MKIDIAKIKAKIAQLNGENKGKGASDVQLWKPGVGDYTIRCLHWPAGVCDEGNVCVDRFFYYGIDRRPILAPEQFDKPDPIAELRVKLYQSGAPGDKELAKKLFAKMRSYVPIIVLEGEDADPEKVIVWSFGSTIYQKILNWFMNEKVGDYFDAHNGFNLTVRITKKAGKDFFDTDVELDALSGRSPIADSEEKIQKILKSIPDISTMYPLKSYEQINSDLQRWLNAGLTVDAKNDSDGKEKTRPKAHDDLDDLVDEVKTTSSKPAPAPKKEAVAKKVADKSADKAPKSVSAPKVVEPVVEEEEVINDDLDSAFEELMGDD